MKYIIIIFLLLVNSIQAQNVVINELIPKNVHTLQEKCERSGCPDLIELYNTTATAIDISGYFLSDDTNTPQKWEIPAGTIIDANNFLLIFAENAVTSTTSTTLRTNFKLSRKGETITLSDASGNQIQQITYPETPSDIAYGRLNNGSYSLLSTPTPNTANKDSSAFEYLSTSLTISIPSGVYPGSQTVTISHTGTGSIYYTLDGSTPTMNSTTYSGPISINNNTILKAIVIENPNHYSMVENRSYIIGANHNLPIILLSTDNSLKDSALRRNKEIIDGRVEFTFIEEDGTTVLNQYADFRESGNASRFISPQINGKIEASSFYGDKDFDHKMYPNKNLDEFNSFLFRNAGQDWFYTRLRDAFVSRLISTDQLTNFPFEGYRPAVFYVNAKYYGIINIREDNDSDYVRHNFKLKDGDFIRQGRRSGYITPDAPLPSNRTDLDELINFNNYTNINLLKNYTALGEIGFTWWKDISGKTGQRYHYNIHDYDLSLGNIRQSTIDLSSSPMDVTSLLDSEIEANSSYKSEALQFTAAAINHLYNTDRTVAIINALEKEIESEMNGQGQDNVRLNNERSRPFNINFFTNLSEWKANVDILRNNIRSRIDANIFNRIQAEYGLDAPIKVSYSSSNINHGFIRVHDIKIKKENDNGNYFSNIPLKLTAKALPGYRFVRWEGDVTDTSISIAPVFNSNATVTAVFEPIPLVTNTAYVNEVQGKNDTTIADENGEFDDWIEIYNPSLSPINLAGLYFSDNPSNPLKYQIPNTNPSKTTVPPNGYLLLWADNDLSQGENHLGFKLKGTDQVIVTYANAVTQKQRIDYANLDTDESYGAESDGSSTFVTFFTPTPNASNNSNTLSTTSLNKNNFSVFPNPTKSYVTIKTSLNTKQLSWKLYSITGTLLNQGNASKINMNALSSGLYFIKINNTNDVIKIIKH